MDQFVDSEARTLPGRRPRTRLFAGLGIALVCAIALGAWLAARARGGGAAATGGATPPLVTVVTPTIGEVERSVSLTGLISARNDVPIGNEGDSARITAVLVEAGAHVRKGQVLARLSAVGAQALVNTADAALDEARSASALAQAEWLRAREGRDLFSKEETEQRRAAAVSAAAKVKAAEAQLADARNRLAHTIIVAPAAGTVLTRSAEVGQIAVPGVTVLFHLARDGEIEMRGQVAEVDMPRLAVGQPARVHLEGIARSFAGTVWQVGSVIDSATRQGTVRIALASADRDLRPGAFARADIVVGRTRGATLPQTAVLDDDRGSYVLIIGRDDKVERRGVRVAGARSAGLLVSAGLTGSERVVAIAGAFLRPGEAVSTTPFLAGVTP
ncbi:MAG: efflux RND transporter periplasmic adaptor subunit [Gammaproteobacteria bacterium]|nr:efflux RND transporter periplasmic adaptor subunit [Gammaproteobacteria bacterium]